MGITKMQGTPVHLEYIKKEKIKIGSCKSCTYYFDGVCKMKNIVIEYNTNGSKLCREYQLDKSFEYKIIHNRRSGNKKSDYKNKDNKNNTNITSSIFNINHKILHNRINYNNNSQESITMGNEIEIMMLMKLMKNL